MLRRGARPSLVCRSLTDPRLRATDEAHIAVNKAARGLFQRHTGLFRAETGQSCLVDRPREHHVAIEKQRPGFRGIPADLGDPFLATEKGLCPALAEIHKRKFERRARHVIRGEPCGSFGHRIVRRTGITDYDRVHASLHGIHETLDDSCLIFDHAQKNEFVLPSHYIVL